MDRPPCPKHFTASRFIYSGEFRHYYAYGNTPAEDLLEHVANESDPSVLLLGCGDIRSCFYTLWKNFDSACGHRNFNGIRFVLNDYCPAVLARNVLFIHLALKLSELPKQDHSKMKDMISAIWSIWYCHELLPNHCRILNEALSFLLPFCESLRRWEEAGNPLRNLLKFYDSCTIEGIHQMYSMWLLMLKGPGKLEWMKSERQKVLLKTFTPMQMIDFMQSFGIYFFTGTERAHEAQTHMQLLFRSKSSKLDEKTFPPRFSLMMDDFNRYVESGSAFAEDVFGLPLSTGVSVNPTLFEKADEYTLPCSLIPFKCFRHYPDHSKATFNDTSPQNMLQWVEVDQKSFNKQPLLANSVQQFTIWLSSVAAIFHKYAVKSSTPINFTMCCSDAIEFAVQLKQNEHKLFDVINASNLIDHISPLAVVVFATQLLKEAGILLTTTLLHSIQSDKIGQYLTKYFGISMDIPLSLWGIRCLGHEGLFAGEGLVQPIPAYQNLSDVCLRTFFPRDKYILPTCMLWQKVKAMPLVVNSLKESSLFTQSLYSCIRLATLMFLDENAWKTESGMCSHTAMMAVSLFIQQLSSESPHDEFEFWEGLCSLLKSNLAMKRYLLHLQCQAFLMNIHMHITVTASDCPMCKNESITEYFQQLSVTFNPSSEQGGCSPVFLAYVHSSDSKFSIDMTNKVHIFDSSWCHLVEAGLKMDILLPRTVIDPTEYNVTIVRYDISQPRNYGFIGSKVLTVPLSSQIPLTIVPAIPPEYSAISASPKTSFGTLVFYERQESQYSAQISLTENVMLELEKGNSLDTTIISDSSFEITCNTLTFLLTFHSPIDYSKIKVNLSQKKMLVKVQAPCKPYSLLTSEQPPLFLVNPENKIAMPTIDVGEFLLNLQMTNEERKFISKHNEERSAMTPIIIAKKQIMALFQTHHTPYFHLTSGDRSTIYGLVVVHQQLFDVQNQTPCLDLSYYISRTGIVSNHICDEVFILWGEMFTSQSEFEFEIKIRVDKDELPLLEKIFDTFSQCTRQPTKHPLAKFGLQQYFRRAVLFHLCCDYKAPQYPLWIESMLSNSLFPKDKDPPITSSNKLCTEPTSSLLPEDEEPPVTSSDKLCTYCKLKLSKVMTCSGCHNASYCGIECQRKHWKVHKSSCRIGSKAESIATSTVDITCGGCGKVSVNLRKCTQCESVKYCSKECQRKDWTKHKSSCIKH